MSKKAGQDSSNLVGSAVVAAFFDMTPRRVQQLTKDEIIPGVKKGNIYKYNLMDTTHAYIRYLNEKAAGRDAEKQGSPEMLKLGAEADLKRSKADIAALELQELLGEMHRSEDVENVMTDLVFSIRSMLLALPGRCAMDLAQIDKAPEVSEYLRKEIYHILEELSNYQYEPAVFAKRVRERAGWREELEEAEE